MRHAHTWLWHWDGVEAPTDFTGPFVETWNMERNRGALFIGDEGCGMSTL